MSFYERLRQLGLLAEAMELNILVWGPGRSLPEDFAKREQLRQAIKSRFPNADVRFSDEEFENGALFERVCLRLRQIAIGKMEWLF